MLAIGEQLERLREQRTKTIESLAGLSEAQLAREAPWRGGRSDVRFHMLRLVEGDDVRRVWLAKLYTAHAWSPPESARVVGLTWEAAGQTNGLLAGLPGALLDRAPAPGEWSVRETLAHIEQVQRRYAAHTAYAVERAHASHELPLRIPDDRLPALASQPAPGEPLDAILERLAALRVEISSMFADLSEHDMAAATIWTSFTVDVRFRLYRLAVHERQHGIQIAKTLAALGHVQSEAEMILRHAEEARGKLMASLCGLPADLADRSAGEGVPSVRALLEQALTEERDSVALILAAC